MATKSEKLKALIWHYANNSRIVTPTVQSVQSDIQKVTGALYGADTIARYLCDWYVEKDSSKKTTQFAKSRRLIEGAIVSLEAALAALRQILTGSF